MLDCCSLCFVAVLKCPAPVGIANGDYRMIPVSPGLGTDLLKVGYYCLDGYKMGASDSPVVVCREGAWQGAVPRCHPRQTTDLCAAPPDIPHATSYAVDGSGNQIERDTRAGPGGQGDHGGPGGQSPSGGQVGPGGAMYPNGLKMLYICDAGYQQQGPSAITCDRGEWSGQGPVCMRESEGCGAPPAVALGEHNLVVRGGGRSGVAEGTQVYYFCNNGF